MISMHINVRVLLHCALVDFTYRVHTLLESNRYVRCALIDFSKAFDMVDHVILARKLLPLASTGFHHPSLLTEHKPPNLAFTSRRSWPLTGQSFKVLALDQTTNTFHNVRPWPQASRYHKLSSQICWCFTFVSSRHPVHLLNSRWPMSSTGPEKIKRQLTY